MNKKENIRKDFDDILAIIKMPKIKEMIVLALGAAPYDFWHDPCSGSGKYHSRENQIDGGIVIHSRKAVQVAISLCRLFDIKDSLIKDKIIAGCVLHDICKNGMPWKDKTDWQHGIIGSEWLQELLMKHYKLDSIDLIDKNLLDICDLVKNHMAIWSSPEPTPAIQIGKEITEERLMNLVVQVADYWASRRWCPFIINELFDIDEE